MDLRQTRCEDFMWIELAQDCIQLHTLVSELLILWVHLPEC